MHQKFEYSMSFVMFEEVNQLPIDVPLLRKQQFDDGVQSQKRTMMPMHEELK